MSALEIPELALVALVGASGSGKSTFAAQRFGRYEVVSSDVCRGMVADDETDQDATKDAFEVLSFVVGKRLDRGRLTVVDATNAQRDARKHLVELARAHDVLPVAIVLDLPEDVCLERNRGRGDRELPARVVTRQRDLVRRAVGGLAREGFRQVHVLRTVEEVAEATIVRTRLRSDLRDEHGPFDVIGDVHGCRSELETLLETLGYVLVRDEQGRPVDAVHPEGRTAVFLGDLVDRGPDTPGVLRLAMGMTAAGHALAVPGNHEHKLVRALDGRKVTVSHGLETSLEQLAAQGPEFSAQVRAWADGMVSHLVLDDGRLVVAHAGLKEAYHGRTSGRVRSFALYGDTTGETDEFGLPVRYPWADDYRGRAMVLYGHTPTPVPQWVNNTMCLDTGVVFGGHLTALRYPSKEIVQVPAEQVWYEPAKPFLVPATTRPDDVLDIEDVLGRRSVETRHHGRITIEEDNAVAALEVMSRFALHPRWLPYLPPTMAPVATSPLPGVLEHPAEAFSAFAANGVTHVICEEKHMGSRATVLVCRDGSVSTRRFGAPDGETGAVWTRTGRAFFDRPQTEVFLAGVRAAVIRSRALGRAGHGLAAARRRAAAVVAQGGSAAARAVRGDGRVGTRDAAVGDVARSQLAVVARARRGRPCWTGPVGGPRTPTPSSTPTAATSGRPTAWTACSWRRSRCSPPRGRRSTTATTAGTCPSSTAWSTPTRCCCAGRSGWRSTSPTRRRGSTGGRSSPRPVARGWWSSRSPTWCAAGVGWCSRG